MERARMTDPAGGGSVLEAVLERITFVNEETAASLDAEDERQGNLEQAEHFEAGRLLGALPGMTHQERLKVSQI
jgi:hypothetical protein